MANRVTLAPEYFGNPTIGRPVANGSVYVGEIDLDPKVVANQKQISVLQEDGTEVEVSQPLSLSGGGYPTYGGSPVTILVTGSYSLRVDDKNGSQVYYVPKNAEATGDKTVETIADLRLISGDYANQGVDVQGYYAVGDGGGGPLRHWDVGTYAPSDDNGGSIIVPTGVTTGAHLISRLDDIGPLDAFGGQVDNTETAVVAANYSALTNLAEVLRNKGGGNLILQVGNINVGGGLEIALTNIKLTGQGKTNTKFTAYNDGNMPGLPTQSVFGGNTTGYHISGITFDNSAYPIANDLRIIWGYASDVTIADCDFICGQLPIMLNNGSNGCKIVNCNFYNSAAGGSPTVALNNVTTNMLVQGCYFETAEESTNVMCSVNTQVTGLVVDGNIIGGSYAAGILCETQSSDKNMISNNIIDVSTIASAQWCNGVYLQFIKSAMVDSNHIIGSATAVSPINVGIFIQISAADALTEKTITNNTIEGFSDGVYIAASNASAYDTLQDVEISNNKFVDIDEAGVRINANNMTGAEATADEVIRINNNTFIDMGSYAIYLLVGAGAGNFEIIGNTNVGTQDFLRFIGGFKSLVIGGNKTLNTAKRLYPEYYFDLLSDTDFGNITFLDKKVIRSHEIDLSGAATTEIIMASPGINKMAVSVSFVYTEASSADAGIVINVTQWGASGTLHNLEIYTTEVSQGEGDITKTLMPSGNNNYKYTFDGYDAGFSIASAGGKTGAGKIIVVVEYIENPGPLEP